MTEDNIVGPKQPSENAVDELNPELDENHLLRLTLYPLTDQENPAASPPVSSLNEEALQPSSARSPSLPKLLTKSLLPFSVLYLLSLEPRYGNEILTWLRQRAGLWAASPGTVYPLLQQLEQGGLIRGRWEPGIKRPRHVYEITETGRLRVEDLRASILPQLQLSLQLLAQLLEELRAAEK